MFIYISELINLYKKVVFKFIELILKSKIFAIINKILNIISFIIIAKI